MTQISLTSPAAVTILLERSKIFSVAPGISSYVTVAIPAESVAATVSAATDFGPYLADREVTLNLFLGTVVYEVKDSAGGGSVSAASIVTALDAATPTELAEIQSSVSWDGMYDTGRHFRFVAGVLRNFNDGGGWRLITPAWSAGHLGLNIDSASSDTIEITINHASIAGTNIVAIVATPDETLASAGFTVGTSVGRSSSQIRIQRRTMMADYVSYNGSSWSSQQGVFTPSFSAGMLTLSHSAVDVMQRGTELSITGRGGVLVPMAGSSTTTTTQVQFFDWSGTLQTTPTADMKIYVNRGQLTAQVNPNNVHVGTYPGSNIWVWGIAEVA